MKKTESNEFAMRLIPSVMSILLCLGLLCTTSLAYFTETVTSGDSKIASASYNTKVALLSIQQPASNSFIISRPGSAEENTVSDNSAVADTPIVDKDGNIVVDAGGGAAPVDPTIIAGGSIETSSSQSNNSLEGEIETVNAGAEFTPKEIVDPYTCSEDGTCLYTFSITAEGTAENGYCEIRVGNDVYRTVQIPVGNSNTITIGIIAKQDTKIEFIAQIGTSAGYAAALMSLDDEETDDGLIGDGEVIEYSGEASLFEEPSDEIDGGDLDGNGSGDGDDDDTIINGGDLDNPDETPGDNPGDNPSDNLGDNPGDNPGDNLGDNLGDNPGENPGDNPGENPGDNPGDNTGENPGDNPGENPDDNPGEDNGDESGETPGETQGGGDEILTVDAAA